jgi:hypothetical protein
MESTTTTPYPQGITFEQVWAALMEDREKQRADKEEWDRRMEELRLQQKRTDKKMGDLHNKFGKMAEHLVVPSITKRFNELGYSFKDVLPGGRIIYDDEGKIKTQVDIILENATCIMAIEIKLTVRAKDIEHHINRIKILREDKTYKDDKRKIRGAIAGLIFEETEKKAAMEAGFYILTQSGKTMMIEVPEGFIPKDW